MKNFLAVYVGSESALETSGWNVLSAQERSSREQAGMAAWGNWMIANAGVVVDQGGPLGKTKRMAAGGVTDIRNNLAGYVIVRAESHAVAAQLFRNHPHFMLFPGDSVEIMECLPIPGAPEPPKEQGRA